MNEKFLENIKKFNMIEEEDRIIAAVSGGADSIFMLYNLYLYSKEKNFELIVAHVNHGVRKTAKRDEVFVKNLAEKFNLTYKSVHVNMEVYGREHKMTDEEAGRFLRYQFFRKLKGDSGKIFLAHNADDQVETVIQRIIRGSGIEGLLAMSYVSGDLYRPMLNIKRKEIEEYLRENDISYVEDETNYLDIYGRNKVRLNLIPYIEENFNPAFKDAILRLSDLAEKNMNFINSLVNEYLKENRSGDALNIKKLKTMDNYFISEVVRKFLKEELSTIDGMSMVNIDQIVKAIKGSESTRISLPKNLSLGISYNSLYIEKKETFDFEEIILTEGINYTPLGKFTLDFNGTYRVEKNLISIDKDKVKGRLRLRRRKEADRFIPLGMKGYKKVKDFFIDEKIERRFRDITPIICDDEEIIWIAPYRMSGLYSIDKKTENIINISMEDLNE
ncbi:tRNA lysidine(34) synthetase TilS [Peptoniphilus catoniae]|uniref:tRNA lysidine(34) synthetase TilS n=1 Tax=Peptoniphilus catoniae TaxID=1660341 RepID=UPI0010FDE719|nr:tRNA lysidine(34) synthetase TilS [Peptoniphilus catoniae]